MALTDPGKGLSVMIFGNACAKAVAKVKSWAGCVLGKPGAGDSDQFPLANAAVGGGQRVARFIAGSPAEAAAEVELAPMALVTGYTGGTVGAYAYVDPANAGKLTETVPSTSGQSKKRVGVIVAADSVLLCPMLLDEEDPTVP